MNVRAKWTVIAAFACRLPNIACSLLRLFFLSQPLSSTSSSYWAAHEQSVTQLSIAYTITTCVVPYLRPLMQAYEGQGGTPRGSKDPSFILSDRSSKGSVSSGRPQPRGLARIASAPGRSLNKATDEPTFSAANMQDISRLLAPEKVASKRTWSAEPSVVIVKTRDWSVQHEDKTSEAELVNSDTIRANPRPSQPSLLAPSRPVARSARSGQDGNGFDAADFV